MRFIHRHVCPVAVMRLALCDRVTGIAAAGFFFPGWRMPRGLQQRRVQRPVCVWSKISAERDQGRKPFHTTAARRMSHGECRFKASVPLTTGNPRFCWGFGSCFVNSWWSNNRELKKCKKNAKKMLIYWNNCFIIGLVTIAIAIYAPNVWRTWISRQCRESFLVLIL